MTRCRRIAETRLDLELGLATHGERETFETHLRECAACAESVAAERRLTAELSLLRESAPPEVDVVRLVASEVAGSRAAPRTRPTPWQLAWSGGGLAAFGAVLLFGLWRIVPAFPVVVIETRAMLVGLGQAISALAAPLTALLATLARVLGSLLRLLAGAAASVQSLEPLVITTVALSAVTMATSIILVVGRDMRRPRWIEEDPRW